MLWIVTVVVLDVDGSELDAAAGSGETLDEAIERARAELEPTGGT
jgi:hypothetical protein